MTRYDRPTLRYPMATRERRRRNAWMALAGFSVFVLLVGWILAPTLVLALLGLAVLGGACAVGVKVHDLQLQRRANDATREVDARLERERWVVATEHETEVAPLGANPMHCDDCRVVHRRNEQRSIHRLATTLGEKCSCDSCTGNALRGACPHPADRVDPAHDIRSQDGLTVHVDAYCWACGYAVRDDV